MTDSRHAKVIAFLIERRQEIERHPPVEQADRHALVKPVDVPHTEFQGEGELDAFASVAGKEFFSNSFMS